MNKTFLVFLILVTLVPGLVLATAISVPKSPMYQVGVRFEPRIVEQPRSAFRSYVDTGDLGIVVPTVIEIPLTINVERKQALVADTTDNVLTPSLWQEAILLPQAAFRYHRSEERLSNLIDGDYTTETKFEVADIDKESEVIIVVHYERPVTASSMTMALSANVALPTSASVRIDSPTGPIALSSTEPTSETLHFPSVTASTWVLMLTYAQPLHVKELRVNQTFSRQERGSASVRFLALPGHRYRVFLDPDQYVGSLGVEAGNLSDDSDVLRISTGPVISNPLFSPADYDGDGVPDKFDNCTFIANSDQADLDKDNRGDACEDFDKDGYFNGGDNCPDHPNRAQSDDDGDGIGDACDSEESRLTERQAWLPWAGIGGAAVILVVLVVLTLRMKPQHPEAGPVDPTQT